MNCYSEKANYDFQMTIDIFGYPASNKMITNQNVQQKLMSKLGKSSAKEEKKLKEYLVRFIAIHIFNYFNF